MPYYRWTGVRIDGIMHSGHQYAASTTILNTLLLKKGIALISCNQSSTVLLPRINNQAKAYYFDRLARLLEAGILVPQAHCMLRDHIGHIKMQIILEEIVKNIEQGASLSTAMAQHPTIFDKRMINMILIGQESGNLAQTARAVAHYLETYMSFKARTRSSLSMPLISFSFFLVIFTVIIIAIVPTIVSVLQSLNLPLPRTTQILFLIGQFIQSVTGISIILLTILSITLISYKVAANKKIIEYYQGLMIRIPIIKTIVCDLHRAWFFNSLALLLRSGIQIVPALNIACHSCTNHVLATTASSISKKVSEGSSFAESLEQCESQFFDQESIAMIYVGQDSGNLISSIEQVAELSAQRALRKIDASSRLISPLFLIILGLLISLLIIAIYTPIFTISAGL